MGYCGDVIYKKYIFGHSDDLNAFLTYMWSLFKGPGSKPPKALDIFRAIRTTGKPLVMISCPQCRVSPVESDAVLLHGEAEPS